MRLRDLGGLPPADRSERVSLTDRLADAHFHPRLYMSDPLGRGRSEPWPVALLSTGVCAAPSVQHTVRRRFWAWYHRMSCGESVEIHQITGFDTRLGP